MMPTAFWQQESRSAYHELNLANKIKSCLQDRTKQDRNQMKTTQLNDTKQSSGHARLESEKLAQVECKLNFWLGIFGRELGQTQKNSLAYSLT